MEDLSLFYLPREIIIAILLRLSFESILVCKLVSKEVLKMIKDPEFSKIYRDKSVAICLTDRRVCRFFFSSGIKLRRLPCCTAESLILFKVGCYGTTKLLSGSSGNIICVKSDTCVFIYRNLLTGASYTVSDAPQRYDQNLGWLCFGFGYDHYDEEYKLLIVCRLRSAHSTKLCERIGRDTAVQNNETSLFWVYSFKSFGWKSFSGFPYAEDEWSPGQRGAHSFSGFLHWVLYPGDRDVDPENSKFLIVTYDLHNCKFAEMSAPKGCNSGNAMVSELDGSLTFVCENEDLCELWAMKEYGVEESWTILFKIDLLSVNRPYIFNIFDIAYMAPYEREDGRKGVMFVCHNDRLLYWYDFTNNKLYFTIWQVKPMKQTENNDFNSDFLANVREEPIQDIEEADQEL